MFSIKNCKQLIPESKYHFITIIILHNESQKMMWFCPIDPFVITAVLHSFWTFVSGNNTLSFKKYVVEQLNAFMTSQFFRKIVIFTLTNVRPG